MSDASLQINEGLEFDAAEQTVQRAWDRFAKAEHSDDIQSDDGDEGQKRRG